MIMLGLRGKRLLLHSRLRDTAKTELLIGQGIPKRPASYSWYM